ncbi:TetR/AcrR family transcriptional regulator [Streptomyces sp. RY43-2]|uniref:TetR/AcrR family transcriptional regulator n=1 Tax=Streptomyces macrolidinus TaxID=2952607 RepID=A0ABT0ZMM4_9ACTN|nr:TetR/AcrR family transcriptional regulator [Streptomyces macrolidinus]MCN9244851.1 TetR/AcrR family transcriptional regulator [Streptomyces macrolidinus]
MERMTADARRNQILRIASEEFARTGLYGTSVETIARKAGISQPYVFRLFGTKKGLFISVVEDSFNKIVDTFQQASRGLSGTEALVAMGSHYRELVRVNRMFLLIQLHGFAACDEPNIRDAMQNGFGRMWHVVQENSGADDVTVKQFLSLGMMLNDMAAMDLWSLDEPWAKACVVALPVENWSR